MVIIYVPKGKHYAPYGEAHFKQLACAHLNREGIVDVEFRYEVDFSADDDLSEVSAVYCRDGAGRVIDALCERDINIYTPSHFADTDALILGVDLENGPVVDHRPDLLPVASASQSVDTELAAQVAACDQISMIERITATVRHIPFLEAIKKAEVACRDRGDVTELLDQRIEACKNASA